MARIRSIKPEFPHSESMGRVSRDARLTFIELWTLADDVGRLRGNSRMLASLLFPYDDDAKDLIEGWLGELDRENCITRYVVDDTSYVQICKWLMHQKIDKPSGSKLPPPPESSRILANPREVSSEDQGLEGKGEEGIGGERKGEEPASVARDASPGIGEGEHVNGKPRGHRASRGTAIPTDFALSDTMREQALSRYPDCDVAEMFTQFRAHHEAHGKAMKSWPAAWVTWLGNAAKFGYPKRGAGGVRWE